VKGPFGFGAPKHQRFAMPFSYDARPSFWQEVRSNSHLVIAAVGTAALLGVAGTALWLAMPAGDRQAFAQVEQPGPVAAPATEAKPAEVTATVQPALAAVEPVAPAKPGPKPDAALPQVADTVVDLATLPANDPRWSGSTHKQARTPAESAAQAQKEATLAAAPPPADAGKPPLPTPEQAAAVAAYQPTQAEAGNEAATAHPNPDEAETAAIPAAKPAAPAEDQGATENGRILRAVTMRSGPKKGAAAIGTIPAKAAVQVVSCKSWCQVVYKGKRGWIYKSFLDSGAKRGSGARDPVQTKSIDAKPSAPAKPAEAEETVPPDPLDARRASGFGHT
jgi:uncharacterized protein YraI